MRLILDVETTGLNTQESDITQLTIIGLSNCSSKIEYYHNQWFSTNIPISEEVYRITGKNNEDLERLSGGKTFNCIEEDSKLMSALRNCKLLIGHNIRFDRDMLKYNTYRHLGYKLNIEDLYCTMRGLKEVHNLQKNPKLSEGIKVLEKYKITLDVLKDTCKKLWDEQDIPFHDARFDTTCTYFLYTYLLGMNYGNNENIF